MNFNSLTKTLGSDAKDSSLVRATMPAEFLAWANLLG